MEKLIILDSSTTAGGGGLNITNNIIDGLDEQGCDFNLVSTEVLNGKTPSVFIEYPEGVSVERRFEIVTDSVRQEIQRLQTEGFNSFVVLSRGYTAYGPQAVKEVIEELNANGIRCRANVFILDSSFPDVDKLDKSKKGRFFEEAFQSDDFTSITMLLNNGMVIPDYQSFPRRFGMEVIATNQPFSNRYRERLLELRGLNAVVARKECIDILKQVEGNVIPEDFERDAFIIPVIANDGVFQPKNAGLDENYIPVEGISGWMTQEQFLQSVETMKQLVESLAEIAEKENIKIIVPLTESAQQIVARDVKELSKNILIANVLPIGPEDTYLRWLRGCSLLLTRTTQAVTTIQGATMGVPVVVAPMPGGKYMDSDLVDPLVKDLGIPYFGSESTKKEMVPALRPLLTIPNELATLGYRSLKAADDLASKTDMDILNILLGR